MKLEDMVVGTCLFCRRRVTEADSWGGGGDSYPPRGPVWHLECKWDADAKRIEEEHDETR